MNTTPFWLAGRPETGDGELTVTHPYDGRVVGTAAVPTPAQVAEAVAAADGVRREAAALPLHVRAVALAHVSAQPGERAEEVARRITGEIGEPLLLAGGEGN